MNISELLQALTLVGEVYRTRDGTKPAEPIKKVIDFLNTCPDGELEDVIRSLRDKAGNAGGNTTTVDFKLDDYVARLKRTDISDDQLNQVLAEIRKLKADEVLLVQRSFSPKRGLKSKQKAIEEIRSEFFRRARSEDRLRQSKSGPLM